MKSRHLLNLVSRETMRKIMGTSEEEWITFYHKMKEHEKGRILKL